jgi:hypothetical protein
MKKRQPEYRFDPEQHAKEEVARRFQCAANTETALTGPQTGQRTVFLFELADEARTKVYAWNEKREDPGIRR